MRTSSRMITTVINIEKTISGLTDVLDLARTDEEKVL